MSEDSELIQVSVLVPRDKVGELLSLAGTLHMRRKPDVALTNGAVAPVTGPTPWAADDFEKAEEVVGAVNARARAIYKLLAEHPGEWLTAGQLDAASGMDGYHRVGLLGSMGRSCKHRGRKGTWKWENGLYMMPPLVAKLFRKALTKY